MWWAVVSVVLCGGFLCSAVRWDFVQALLAQPLIFEGSRVAALVPPPEALSSFWAPVAHAMRRALCSLRCVLDEDEELCLPSEALLRPSTNCPIWFLSSFDLYRKTVETTVVAAVVVSVNGIVSVKLTLRTTGLRFAQVRGTWLRTTYYPLLATCGGPLAHTTRYLRQTTYY